MILLEYDKIEIINRALSRLPDQVFAYTTYINVLYANVRSFSRMLDTKKYIEFMKSNGVAFRLEDNYHNLEIALSYIQLYNPPNIIKGIFYERMQRDIVYTNTMSIHGEPITLTLSSNSKNLIISLGYNKYGKESAIYFSDDLNNIKMYRYSFIEYVSTLINYDTYMKYTRTCHKCEKVMITGDKHSHYGKSCQAVHASYVLPEICVVPAVIDDIICSYC